MKNRILSIFIFAIVSLSAKSFTYSQDLVELRKKVELFSLKYNKVLKNVSFDAEGRHAGVDFRGSFAILNNVRPYKFPHNGAFRFTRTELKSSRQVIKIGNPQYSFRLEKLESDPPPFQLKTLEMQFGQERTKDSVFRTFSSVDSWAIFAPIMVLDLTSTELLRGDNGVKVRIVKSDEPSLAVVEFDFPSDHPFGHVWAKVSFGENGEVLNYELKDPGPANSLVTYSHYIVYSDTLTPEFDLKLPSEFRERQQEATQEFRLSNFQFGRNKPHEFTLSHYGIPEPEGTSVLGGHIPYWLIGTVAGAVFLGIGIYLKKRTDRSN